MDWYRYNRHVLRPLLVPFIHEIISKYGEAILVSDGAPSHVSWQHEDLLNIEGLTILHWPGNSPDLNESEPGWYELKRQISKRPFAPTTKQGTIDAAKEEWANINQDKVNAWCMSLVERMDRVRAHRGGNNFHG